MPSPPLLSTPAVVLDTNAVLDWLVFKDANMTVVAAAIQEGHLRWLACGAMRDELARTLGLRSLARWKPDSEHVLANFDRFAARVPAPPAAPMTLRCSDPDDQIFLDLALEHRAPWLLTHDRALLRLAKRSSKLGVCITQARNWSTG